MLNEILEKVGLKPNKKVESKRPTLVDEAFGFTQMARGYPTVNHRFRHWSDGKVSHTVTTYDPKKGEQVPTQAEKFLSQEEMEHYIFRWDSKGVVIIDDLSPQERLAVPELQKK